MGATSHISLKSLFALAWVGIALGFSQGAQAQAALARITEESLDSILRGGPTTVKEIGASEATGSIKAILRHDTGELIFLTEKGELAVRIPKPSAAELEQNKPSHWKQLMKGSGATLKAGLHQGASSVYERFIPDSLSFMVALGEVAAKNMITHYNENPAAFDKYIQNEGNFASRAGFAAFISTNAFSGKIMRTALESPQIRALALPSLAMSTARFGVDNLAMVSGSLASEATSTAVGSESKTLLGQLKRCSISSSVVDCDAAYFSWSHFWHSRWYMESAPNLAGLIGGTFLAMGSRMFAVGALTEGSKLLARGLIKVASLYGVEMAFALTPAGDVIDAAMWILQTQEMAGMVDFSDTIESAIRSNYRNHYSIGPTVAEEAHELLNYEVRDYSQLKSPQSHFSSRFYFLIQSFSKDIDDLIQNNMATQLTAYNGWIQKMNKYSDQYLDSELFYKFILDQLWQNRYGPVTQHVDMLRLYPLFGVNTKTMEGHGLPDTSAYLSDPDGLEQAQIAWLREVYKYLVAENMATPEALRARIQSTSNEWTRGRLEILANMPPEQKQRIWKYFLNPLQSINTDKPNWNDIANALRFLPDFSNGGVKAFEYSEHDPINSVLNKISMLTQDRYLMKVKEIIGEPFPCMVPGQGFVRATYMYMRDNHGGSNPFGHVGLEQTDYLLLQMLSGPDIDKNSSGINSLTTMGWNWLPEFHPPAVHVGAELKRNFDINSMDLAFGQIGQMSPVKSLFSDGFSWPGHPGYTQPKNPAQFLIENGVRSSVLNPQTKSRLSPINSKEEAQLSPDIWWNAKVEPELLNIWKDASIRYQGIASDFLEQFRSTSHMTYQVQGHNVSMPLGGLALLEFEFQTYMTLLDRSLNVLMPKKAGKLTQEMQLLNDSFHRLIHQFDNYHLETIPGHSERSVSGGSSKDERDQSEKQLTGAGNAIAQLVEDKSDGESDANSAQVVKFLVGKIFEVETQIANYEKYMNAANFQWQSVNGSLGRENCTQGGAAAGLAGHSSGSGCGR
jgi:hypothetical protein